MTWSSALIFAVVVLPAAAILRGHNAILDNGQSVSDMRPEIVASLLSEVEKEWEQDRLAALVGDTSQDEALQRMQHSCMKVGGSIVQGSSGDVAKVTDYMKYVCAEDKNSQEDTRMCEEFATGLTGAMKLDPAFNRESLNLSGFCKSFFEGAVTDAANIAEDAEKQKRVKREEAKKEAEASKAKAQEAAEQERAKAAARAQEAEEKAKAEAQAQATQKAQVSAEGKARAESEAASVEAAHKASEAAKEIASRAAKMLASSSANTAASAEIKTNATVNTTSEVAKPVEPTHDSAANTTVSNSTEVSQTENATIKETASKGTPSDTAASTAFMKTAESMASNVEATLFNSFAWMMGSKQESKEFVTDVQASVDAADDDKEKESLQIVHTHAAKPVHNSTGNITSKKALQLIFRQIK